MDYDFAMKWADALESGEYEQAKGKLFDGKGYCCLGVACVLLGKGFIAIQTINDTFFCEGRSTYLPLSVKKQIDMRSHNGTIYDDVGLSTEVCLAGMNDTGKSFSEIAAVIRKDWMYL